MIARLDRNCQQNVSAGPARRPQWPAARGAFTLTEIVIAAALVVVLMVMFLPVVTHARRASQSVSCLSHLRALNTAFHLYSQNNSDQLPNPGLTQIPWEHSLIGYCSADAFICPGDDELSPATNSSYDWRDTGVFQTTLAGFTFASAKRSDAVLVFDSLPDWHEKSRMNVALVDGSARSMSQDECVIDLATPLRQPPPAQTGTNSSQLTPGH